MTTNHQTGTQQFWQQAQPGQGQAQAAQGQTQPGLNDDLLNQALQGASALAVPAGGHTQAIERSSGFNLLDLIFNNAEARRNMAVIDYIHHIYEENRQGTELSGALILGCANTLIENEAALEGIIQKHAGSKLALSSVPLYVPLFRKMQLEYLPEITQTGIQQIKNKLERR